MGVTTKLAGVAAGVLSVRAAINFATNSFKAFAEEQDAITRLDAALRAAGQAGSGATAAIQELGADAHGPPRAPPRPAADIPQDLDELGHERVDEEPRPAVELLVVLVDRVAPAVPEGDPQARHPRRV